MQALKDILKSERGLALLMYWAMLSVFCFLGRIPFEAWNEWALYALGIYTAGKSATGAVAALTGRAKPAPGTLPSGQASDAIAPGGSNP